MRLRVLVSAICVVGLVARAEPRWVRVACTQGPDTLEKYGLPVFEKALDYAGRAGADLVLLPEYVNGEMVPEPLEGPSARLMSAKAREYRMLVAGTIARQDTPDGRLRNTALLFGRDGKLIGSYDKIHLYGDELKGGAMAPGATVPVFATDFGKVAFVTCNDIAFADVASSATRQGAGILLFPNLGYSPAVAQKRAAENRVWMIASSRSGTHNVWDPSGNDLLATATPRQAACRDINRQVIDGLGVLMVTLRVDAGR
jgi:predicted amidohydrolase